MRRDATMTDTTDKPDEKQPLETCPRCGHWDWGAVDSKLGERVVACNGCNLYFDPRTGKRVQ